jgi:hypothetical protein
VVKPKNGVLQGTLVLMVLRTLAREPMHGYGITLHIHVVSAADSQARCSQKRRSDPSARIAERPFPRRLRPASPRKAVRFRENIAQQLRPQASDTSPKQRDSRIATGVASRSARLSQKSRIEGFAASFPRTPFERSPLPGFDRFGQHYRVTRELSRRVLCRHKLPRTGPRGSLLDLT